MKIQYFRIVIALVAAIFLFNLMLIAVPTSYAQSAQVWSDPINLSNAGSSTNPTLVVDAAGITHVIWVDEFDGYKYAKSEDGIHWTSPRSVKFPFVAGDSQPVLLASESGDIYALWLDAQNALYYSKVPSASFDVPSKWATRKKLADSVMDFDAVVSPGQVLHIAYASNLGTDSHPAGVYYSQLKLAVWSSSQNLYSSQYFRSTAREDMHVNLAVTEEEEMETVYIVWDDVPRKRIVLGISNNDGQDWTVNDVVVPDPALGFKTPSASNIEVRKDELLLTWHVGEPGAYCALYSSTSEDKGASWDEPVRILPESPQCPERSDFIPTDSNYSSLLLTIQGNLFLIVWNGSQWSNLELQSGPSSFTNPETLDPVVLACKETEVDNNRLFVVGCDQGASGDIWFLSRELEALENLFPLPSAWSGDMNVTTITEAITSLSSVSDAANNVHAVWVQSPSPSEAYMEPHIAYSRWNGEEWTRPTPIIADSSGLPLNLTLQIDNQQRLLLSWIDQRSGELLFSWANSGRANIPLEWMPPIALSSSSQLTNSPDMLVDASDRIVIAYAVTLNEERGIYVIQSTDLGATWSSPVRVFDAVSANWEMIDQPKLAVTIDGKLHILFTKYTLLGSRQAVGLYYSQSSDGGLTWTTPETITKNPVEWSEMAAFKQTLYRFWGERNQSSISLHHQISSDSGMNWSSPTTVPSPGSIHSGPTISLDGTGRVHLLQIAQEDDPILQEWDWSTERPQLVETRDLGILQDDLQMEVESGITPQGVIYALIQSGKLLPTDEIETSLVSMSHSLGLKEAGQPILFSISTPSSSSLTTLVPELQQTPTQVSPLANISETQSPISKNLVGVILIVSIVLILLYLMIPRRSRVTHQTRQSNN